MRLPHHTCWKALIKLPKQLFWNLSNLKDSTSVLNLAVRSNNKCKSSSVFRMTTWTILQTTWQQDWVLGHSPYDSPAGVDTQRQSRQNVHSTNMNGDTAMAIWGMVWRWWWWRVHIDISMYRLECHTSLSSVHMARERTRDEDNNVILQCVNFSSVSFLLLPKCNVICPSHDIQS